MLATIEYAVVQGDVLAFDADVIALKYAQSFHGVDKKLADSLISSGTPAQQLEPQVGTYRYVETSGHAQAKHALFVGVPPLTMFSYPDIRIFASLVLRGVNQFAPAATHICMTIHGVGYGLDEIEASLAQLEGCLDVIQSAQSAQFLPNLRRITIVERNAPRVERLRTAINQYLENGRGAKRAVKVARDGTYLVDSFAGNQQSVTVHRGAGAEKASHVFVAMPFDSAMNDVFYYGIEAPIRAAGFLCERMDHVTFTGDIMDWMKRKIESASLVIAEMTGANPNVYLEVGYAWGKDRQTLLLAKSGVNLEFDAKGHRCIFYQSIKDLEGKIQKEMAELKDQNLI